MNKASVIVYGADIVCASCVNAPTARNTYDWLQPLLKRKYPDAKRSFGVGGDIFFNTIKNGMCNYENNLLFY